MSQTLKKNVCVVTAARSEYGLLRWVIDELKKSDKINTQIIVTGAHLLKEQGLTYREIEKDGNSINAFVDMKLDASSTVAIARSMGYCATGIAEAFDNLKPDMLVVLGDRYELLPICSTALVMNIPIAHISGGDVTEGAIDDSVRNAITMLSTLHFPGNAESAANIARMIGTTQNIFNVGEPGLDNFKRLTLMTREELAENLGIDSSKKWVLMTYHPETKVSLDENLKTVANIVEALKTQSGIEVVITKANADFGGEQINNYLQTIAENNPTKFKIYASLGQLRYISFMKQAALIIGNSSSGIFEAPYCSVPVINIGHRQKGRYCCDNILSVSNDIKSINAAICKFNNNLFEIKSSDTLYYGDGTATIKIADQINDFLWK